MSDDVRSRAEADLAGSVRWALDHCEAGVMPVGGVMSLRAALLAYNESRAALAVAPATAVEEARREYAEAIGANALAMRDERKVGRGDDERAYYASVDAGIAARARVIEAEKRLLAAEAAATHAAKGGDDAR